MKTAEAIYDHRHNGTETFDFLIDPSGKAFRTLIDKLYSNKIESIVRELSTNAWDSHKSAEKLDVPFSLHCPNALYPFFAVRDYGIGMDHRVVTEVFRTLFKSTKDQDNEAAGKFGLGAKSPWSICSLFTIQCYDGASRRDYAAAIGADGRPQLHFAGEQPSDEPKGVRIEVPVKDSQFQAFQDAVETVTRGFDTPPECNIQHLVKPLREADLQGDGFRYWNSKVLDNNGFYIRMGCVIYPLTETGGLKLPVEPFAYGRKPQETTIIECPIGAVEVTSSRESLEYDEGTVAYLQSRIDALPSEMVERIRRSVSDIKNHSEFFREVSRRTPSYCHAQKLGRHPATGLESAGYLFHSYPALIADGWDENFRYEETYTPSMSHAGDALVRVANVEDLLIYKNGERALLVSEEEEPQDAFTSTEQRKVRRQLRRVCLNRGWKRALFMFSPELTDDFLSHITDKPVFDMTAQEILDAKTPPSVTAQRSKTKGAVKGLRLYTAGEYTPAAVLELGDVDPTIPWLESEMWGKRVEDTKKFLSWMGHHKAYLASPTAEVKIQSTGAQHLFFALKERVEDYGVSLTDFYHSEVRSNGFSHKTLGRKLDEAGVLEQLITQRNDVAKMFRLGMPFVRLGLREDSMPVCAREMLLKWLRKFDISETASSRFRDAEAISRRINDHSKHPLREVLDDMAYWPTQSALEKAPALIKALSAIAPFDQFDEFNWLHKTHRKF